jgi:hypothetical protein
MITYIEAETRTMLIIKNTPRTITWNQKVTKGRMLV